MPGKYLIVSIFDVVFARGEPLAETELWSVLHQCAICLLELLQHGDKNFSEISSLAVTPDSLGFRSDGSAGISSSTTQQRNLYSAPELHHGSCKSVRDLEKSFIYSLGKVLYYAAEYSPDRNQDVCISRNLDSILSAMCEENPASRLSVEQVLQACSVHAERYMDCDYHLCTRQMYTYIMGSSESEEDSMQGIQSLSGKDKENRARRVRGKHKRKSRSRSRSRSPSRRDRSDDSSYYQSLKGQRHGNRSYDVNQPPPYHEHLQRSLHSTPPSAGRSYHLSDITFSLDSNVSSHKSKNHHSQSNVISPHNNPPHSRPTSGISSHKNETAYDKYVRLKERQRKLKILRQGLFGDLPEDQTSSILSDPIDFPGADTRSQISYTQGAYMPELYNKYGSEMALRMGRESDRESIISSEASLIHDHHAMRSADVYHVAEQQQQQPVVEKMTRQKTSDTNLPPQKTKEYYGPEFVHKTSKPIIRVPVTMRGDSLKSASHGRRVVIVLLTGQKLEAMVDPSTTGQQMFESIITHIELPEFFFFGLTYVNDGEHFFIEPDMKLHKIAPEGWKDGWKGNMPTITLTIYLRLKFYPDHIGMLRHQISRHLLYLQLRHDILEERLLCNEDRCMALTGLALQAEYGDYDKETMGRNYFMQEHYYPNRIIKRVGTGYIRDNTSDVHEKHSGITDRQAELEFIKMCLNLHEYGVHFYKLNRRKNDNNSIVWVGISVRYLVLAENQSYQRVIIQQDPWNMIQKISFNKHRFSIQSKPDYGKGKPPKLNYFTNSFRKGRYLLQFSTAQHRFQLNMRAREAQIDSQDLTLDSLAQLDVENNMADQGGVDIEHLPESPGPEGSSNNRLDEAGPADRCPIPYMHPPPYMADTSVSMLDLRQRYTLPQHKRDPRMHAASTGDIVQEVNREVSTEPMYVIEMASQSLDPLEDMPPNETVSTSLQNRISNELLSPEYPDRHVFEVTLEKEPQAGIGITIVGGESTSKLDLGIFVKSVTPKGPADRDGRIKSGDRLIAINEQSLEGVQHHVAVQMIRDSTEKVKLLVSQIKPPSSIRRKSYDDVTPVKLRGSKASPSDKDVYRKISSASSSSSVAHSVHSHVNMDSNINTDQKNVDIPVNTYSNDDQSVVDGMTMSHVESMQSELISASEHLHVPPPVHDPDDTENDAESLTDSEIDEGIQAIVDGRTLEKMKIQDSIRPAEQDEWMKIENIESPKHHVTMSDDTYKVILGKKDGGFGLSVMGGADTSAQNGGIYVRSLTEGGPASLEGSIRTGDRILEVHEIPLRGVTYKQALDIIDQAPTICIFVMQRRAPTSQRSSVRSISSGSSAEVQNMKQKVVEEKVCVPRVEPGVKAEVDIIHREYSDAEKDGEGREVKSEEESESSSVLSSGGPYTSKGENDQGMTADTTEMKDPFVNEENIYSVDLTKGSSGLGFSVHGGVDVETPGTTQGLVHIKKLFGIGPAAASGKIQEGDVILEVNGQSVKGLTHAEAMAVLRSASQVNLLMYRPSPEQLSQMFIPESEDLVHHQPSSKKLEETSCSETESEDEPILYRDTLPLREEVISPPSAFTSPRSEYSEEFVAPPPPKSPPPLPKSPPPSFSVQSSPGIPGARKIASPSLSLRSEPAESGQDGQAMGRWGNFENLKLALSPRSVYSEDMNSTTEEEYEESDMDERFNQRVQLGGYLKKLARSESSQSEDSQSSTDSIVRSPLKDTYGTSDSMRSTNSVDDSRGYDINTGEWHEEVDGELSDFQEPSAPRGSPCEDDEEWNRVEERGRREEDLKESENSEEELTRSLGPGEMEVVLRKEEGKGLGFTFTGGVSKGGCFIKGIVHDPALSDGRLKAGDKLIKVNDIDLTNLSHAEAVTYFKEAVGNVRIRVYRDPHQETAYEEEDQKSGNIGLGLRLELTDSLLSQSSGYEADSALTTGELTDVTGIVTQGDDSNVKHTEKLFSFLDGQTDNSQDESDSESDKETPKKEINCTPLDNNDDDVTSGAERKTSITEELSDNPPQTYPPYNVTKQSLLDAELSFQSEPKVIKIELSKSQACGLGFSLVTAEKDNQTGVFVRSISAHGAADQDGRLQVMDRILQINGESLVGLTHTRAIQMIRSAKDSVLLTVSRLSLRQLDVMTPPIIMNNSDDEDEDDYDVDEFSDGERYDDQQQCESDDYEYDSEEEEEMNALVTAAEKLLAESGTIEFNQEQINNIPNQGSFVEQMKDKWGDRLQQSDSEHSESDEEHQQINVEQNQATNSEELQQTNTGELQRTNTDELQQGNTNELEFTNTDYTQSSNIEELQQMNSDEEQQGNTANLELLQSEELPGVNSAELQQVNLEQLQQTNNEELKQTKSSEQPYLGELQQIDTNEFHEPLDNVSISQMDNDAKNKTFTIVALQRKLDVEIPDTVTDTWISSLPLLIMAEEARPSVPSLIKQIQHKIDQDDPVEEYKELRQVKATDDCTIARLPENKSKNRFRNILPYDLNRVTLSSDNDYINASHILMSVGELESHYIACQGPLLNTSEDFWQMVWEQDVSVVTMLTLDIENRKVKCHQYWPDSMETPLFICDGKYKISLVSIQSLEHINIQTIEMSDLLSGRAHTVYHFTYKSWPDHGVPQSLPLLQCLQLVHVYHTTGPIVVHCSAGIGRTGAFITMDLALGQIEKSGRCDIFEIVTELRKQRSGMIQTKDQYLLCYLACLEALTSVS